MQLWCVFAVWALSPLPLFCKLALELHLVDLLCLCRDEETTSVWLLLPLKRRLKGAIVGDGMINARETRYFQAFDLLPGVDDLLA